MTKYFGTADVRTQDGYVYVYRIQIEEMGSSRWRVTLTTVGTGELILGDDAAFNDETFTSPGMGTAVTVMKMSGHAWVTGDRMVGDFSVSRDGNAFARGLFNVPRAY